MNIIEIINNLYTNRHSKWILELEDSEIAPFVIQRWLLNNDNLRVQVRWLDKYVFSLPPKMYLSLAWSIIPKTAKVPFVPFIKVNEEEEKFDFLLTKVRKHLEMGDNDYKANKSRIIQKIKNNMVEWFSYYGVDKKKWKEFYLDFDLIKKFGETTPHAVKKINEWGLANG